MAEKSTCKYLLGICYTCQKCLYCFKNPQQSLCKCKKNKQPARVSNPKRGQQIYQRIFTLNQLIPTANEFLSTANTKFDYNNNFNESFSYTFCAACNSKFQRLVDKDKGKKCKKRIKKASIAIENKIFISDVKYKSFSIEKGNNIVENNNNVKGDNNIENDNSVAGVNSAERNNASIEEDNNVEVNDIVMRNSEEKENSEGDNNEEEDSNKEDNVEEIKVQITIKNKDKKTPTAKTLTIQPANYKNVMEKINLIVQKFLGRKIKMIYYTISRDGNDSISSILVRRTRTD